MLLTQSVETRGRSLTHPGDSEKNQQGQTAKLQLTLMQARAMHLLIVVTVLSEKIQLTELVPVKP